MPRPASPSSDAAARRRVSHRSRRHDAAPPGRQAELPSGFDEAVGRRAAVGPENATGRRRIGHKETSRPDRTPHEFTATVRADAVQDLLDAVTAPGALVRADEHVRRGRVEVSLAAFAVRSQLQHALSIRPPEAVRGGARYTVA